MGDAYITFKIVWGQTRIDSGIASILNATTPIFTVILAHMLTSDEHLNPRKMIGVLTGFLGVFIMMAPELKDGFSWRGLGQIAILGATVSYGCAGIFGKRFKDRSPVVNSAGMLICSSIIRIYNQMKTRSILNVLSGVFQPGTLSYPTYTCRVSEINLKSRR